MEKDFEMTGIKLQTNQGKLQIIGVYRSPSGNLEQFFSKLEFLLHELINSQQNFVVVGDFNIDVLDTSSPTTKRFDIILRSFDLSWSINSPTRVTTTSATAIDNVILNVPNATVSVVNTAISDHYGQEVIIRGFQPCKEPITLHRIRDLSQSNIGSLNYSLSHENWDFLKLEGTAETKFNLFQNTFFFHLNHSCPIKTIKIGMQSKKKSWITKGILVSRDKLKLISELKKNSDNAALHRYFKTYRKTYKKVIMAAKAYDISKSIVNSDNVSRTAWKFINDNKNQPTKNKMIQIKINGKTVSEPSRIADEFNVFFSSVATRDGLCTSRTDNNVIRSPLTSMALMPVTEEDVARVIQQLPSKKSNDADFNSPWLIKQCSKHILSPLTQLVNLSFETGIFPSRLKVAKITPVFKKGDPFCKSNYRPISILPVVSKIFEKLFLNQLTNFLDKHSLLSNKQFGFRKGKSTTDAVARLVEMVVDGLDNRRPTQSVFLDLSKAFDCVDHKMLLQKLEDHGIRGLPLSWLTSFLEERSQTVQIADHISQQIPLRYGVPQGSILSPLLFLVYVNDIQSSLQYGRLVQYADDTSLCFSSNSKESLELQTYVELNCCIQAFHKINLKTNATKSNFINFCLHSAVESAEGPAVLLSDTFLEEVYSTNFLGIHLDRGLTWENHVDFVCKKIASGLFVLRRLSKYCPIQVLKMAYYGLIYPYLSYGIVLWGSGADSQILRVFKLQKKAVRILARLKSRETCKLAFQSLGLLTLPCLYILETILFCISKCNLTRGRDIHEYETRSRDEYRMERYRTTVRKRLPAQAGVSLYNSLPESLKSCSRSKAFKTRLKKILTAKAFYSVAEFMTYHWETD